MSTNGTEKTTFKEWWNNLALLVDDGDRIVFSGDYALHYGFGGCLLSQFCFGDNIVTYF